MTNFFYVLTKNYIHTNIKLFLKYSYKYKSNKMSFIVLIVFIENKISIILNKIDYF